MLEPLMRWLEWKLQALLIWTIKGICLGLWYVEKALAWLGEQIMTADAWNSIIDTLLNGLAATLPDTLRSVLFGTGGGLFYLALMAVSILLVVPQLVKQQQRPVQLERVLGWSMVVTVLFISSTVGYDAITLVEGTRMETVTGIISGWGAGSVTDLVANPMSATTSEVNVSDLSLPAAFEAEYFPEPSAYEVVEIVFYDAPLLGTNSSTVNIETAESLTYRIGQASLAIILTILNLIPTVLVVILTLTFAALTASALVLILFFLLALPIGLFEVGGAVISQIASRYLLIWALSIFVSTFPAILLGIAELTLTPPVTLTGLFTYLAILIVAVIAVHHVAKWVYHVATDSFAVIGQTVNAALTPYAYGVTNPTANQLPPGYAAAIMGGAALGGVVPYAASYGLHQAAQNMGHGLATAAGMWGGDRFERWRSGRGQQTQSGSSQTVMATQHRESGLVPLGSQGSATTAMATTSTAVTPPRTHHHVFAYLDEPDVVQG
ncbi:MAG: hypothetical protein KDE51_10450, partial [Anaerolineales bacterium]|nr:hypothetical protein [Anaerolineales bacterium]